MNDTELRALTAIVERETALINEGWLELEVSDDMRTDALKRLEDELEFRRFQPKQQENPA